MSKFRFHEKTVAQILILFKNIVEMIKKDILSFSMFKTN